MKLFGWVVLRTKPRFESRAAANAENKLNLESYAPKIREFGKVSPLFPGYAFVRARRDFWTALLRLTHVRGILMAGDHPSWLEDSIIDEIRTYEQKPQTSRFTLGQNLVIGGGPFSYGLYAGMTSQNRVKVLCRLLGREVPIEFELERVRA